MKQTEADNYFKNSKSYEIMDVYNEDDVNPLETQDKSDPNRLALARTSWGEGRNQGRDGMHLIQHVIKNRANSGGAYNWPENVFDVTRQSKQFSAWNPNDPNKAKMESLDPTSEDKQFQEAYEISDQELPKELLEIFGDADHYHTDKVSPSWSKSPKMRKLGQHGSHIFYSTKPGTGVSPAANMKGGTL
jgi:N-acetylmuramoyl-L-alanine amidase